MCVSYLSYWKTFVCQFFLHLYINRIKSCKVFPVGHIFFTFLFNLNWLYPACNFVRFPLAHLKFGRCMAWSAPLLSAKIKRSLCSYQWGLLAKNRLCYQMQAQVWYSDSRQNKKVCQGSPFISADRIEESVHFVQPTDMLGLRFRIYS